MYNPEIESASRTQMQEWQLNGLKSTVKKVYENVDFYKKKFDELGIKPEDIQTFDDITKLPFTIKKDFRDTYPYGLFAEPLENINRIHGSSGTSGKPTIVGYTKNDLKNWGIIVARAIVAAGGKKSDVFHNAYGYGLFTGGLGLHQGAEELGVITVPISGGNTDRQITLINDLKPRGICGTPSYILSIVEKMEDMGIDPRETNLDYGIFGAEVWSEEMRSTLEKKLNIKAVDIYGLSEIMGPGVAVECHEEQNGLHIAEDHFYVEVIDKDTLQPVEDGESGELVFTSLQKEALPIIRYRTGDIASINREQCKCGRTTTRMSRIKGRTDDMIIIRGVNVFPSEMERVLLQVRGLVPVYQIHLIRKGAMDGIELHVECETILFDEVGKDLKHDTITLLKRTIQHQMKSTCLITIDIVVNPPKTIPRSEGKAIRLVDKRKQSPLGV
ncbi:phenylacetate--CoA ligase family protein [Paenisporosarcina antarctica]|uniref:Phenylacetate-coenzyme A ligase n=1 Tax=Paenisporosarcina antarctica TaxID=417367 RepID=A0A4P6ZXJ2_9BACL|nr:AMP-binding protein [Paenisporosarcina antarctica]QBP41132.1 phenylacetate--CoA ligase [Paenisporosarcina antarctica]